MVFVKFKMKIEVRNEEWPRGAYPRGLRLGRDPVEVTGIVAPFTLRGVGIPGKLLFSRCRGENVFVGSGNGLPAALPLASPKRKILMASHWCCRVIPPGRVAVGSLFWENSCSQETGGKSAGSVGEVQSED